MFHVLIFKFNLYLLTGYQSNCNVHGGKKRLKTDIQYVLYSQ